MKTYAYTYSYIPESMRLTERKLEQMRGELIEAISRNLPFSKNDLSVLLTRELYIIAARYGFLNGEEATLEAIGNSLGVTRQRVHYLLRRALNRIRRLNQGMA
jgi:DNA-directed RNA polymerase sigma subunit (sigma70/sigma32)